jgi:hypothetical protein
MNNSNPSVFIILSGSFASGQITKIRKQGSYNFPPVERFPIPMVEHIQLNDEEITATTDSNTAGREEQICWRYWFPTNGDPNCFSGTHKNQSEFAKALFVGESPTLLFHPSKVVSHAKLSQLCPLAFPFGTGDVDVDCRRKPYVSDIECLQHYTKISLPQFQDGQTILIIHHIYHRRKSFLTGIAKCNIANNGNSIANQLSTISLEHIDDAITTIKAMPRTSGQSSIPQHINNNVSQLLHCVRTSCVPIGYTNEAAA